MVLSVLFISIRDARYAHGEHQQQAGAHAYQDGGGRDVPCAGLEVVQQQRSGDGQDAAQDGAHNT